MFHSSISALSGGFSQSLPAKVSVFSWMPRDGQTYLGRLLHLAESIAHWNGSQRGMATETVPAFNAPCMQMDVTSRDRYGNEISTGDPGIQIIGKLDEDTVRDSFQRTVAGAVTTFRFSVYRYGTYTWRFELPDGGLVYQGKTHTFQGFNQRRNSYQFGVPSLLQAGETFFGGMKVRDLYGWFFHFPQSAKFDHQVYNTTDTNLSDSVLMANQNLIGVRRAPILRLHRLDV